VRGDGVLGGWGGARGGAGGGGGGEKIILAPLRYFFPPSLAAIPGKQAARTARNKNAYQGRPMSD